MAGKPVKNQDEHIDDEVVYEEASGGNASENKGGKGFLNNPNLLYYGLGAVALLAAFLFYRNYSKKQSEAEAQGAMVLATSYYNYDSLSRALNGIGGDPGFLGISEQYAGTQAANVATYYAGVIQLRQGAMEPGKEALESFKKGDNFVAGAAYAALAYTHEQAGEFKEAAEQYELAARKPRENDGTTPLYLLHAGRNLEAAGDRAGANKLYTEIKEKYPNSTEAANIDLYIGRTYSGGDE